MSTWTPRAVQCRCGHRQRVDLADGLHISRMPEVRQRILDGTFHNATCQRCGVLSVIHTKTLYTDFERFHWVAVAPPWYVGDWAGWADALTTEFHHNLRVAAPPMIQAIADRFTTRVVFGLDALAEKLRAWDAGLDDRVVEAMKLRFFLARRERFGPGFRFRLADVDRTRWTLELTLTHPPAADNAAPPITGAAHAGPSVDVFTCSLDEYLTTERLLGEPGELADYVAAEPALMATPFGGLDRVFATSLAGATHARDYMHVVEPLRPQDADPAYPRPGYPLGADPTPDPDAGPDPSASR